MVTPLADFHLKCSHQFRNTVGLGSSEVGGQPPRAPTFLSPFQYPYLRKTSQTLTMTRFRPCIDLHAGRVKQIIGGTLSDSTPSSLQTNHISPHSAGYFTRLYKEHDLTGAHVIMLGPGNEDAAREACEAWSGGLQVGGGITEMNCAGWVDWGAGKVCG